MMRDILYIHPETTAQKRDRVLRDICERHDVSLASLQSKQRHKHIIPARFEACYRLRNEAGLSWSRIGKILGGRDHSTVIHGARMHALRNGLPELSRQGICRTPPRPPGS